MKKILAFSLMMIVSNNLLAASYEVPVSAELNEFAKFELPSFKNITTATKITIKYQMPKILTGSKEEVELSGAADYTGNEFVLTGDKGVAKCIKKDSATVCTIEYSNLVIDENKAMKEIQKISQDVVEANKRVQIMRAFSTDPVGIVYY